MIIEGFTFFNKNFVDDSSDKVILSLNEEINKYTNIDIFKIANNEEVLKLIWNDIYSELNLDTYINNYEDLKEIKNKILEIEKFYLTSKFFIREQIKF